MAPDSEPRMLADPVSGFFAGITSTVARMLIGFAGILAGCFLCFFSAFGWKVDALTGLPLAIFMIFAWATHGGWFVIGMVSLISIFACLWAFVHDSDGKLSFFLIFTSAAIYFSPLAFGTGSDGYDDESHPLVWLLGIYAAISACYWLLPWWIALVVNRNADEAAGAEFDEPDAVFTAQDDSRAEESGIDAENNEADA